MENNLQVFSNEHFGNLRVIIKGDEYWFVGKDVATALGYTNPLKAVRDHVNEDDKGMNETFTPAGGKQQTLFINESGLYSLILSSKLPNAKEFKHWVTKEVLPSIRKTGSYISPAKSAHASGYREKEAMARLMNARSRQSKIWMQLADTTSIKELKEVAQVYAANTLAGKEILALPEVKEKTYTATEIADMLGTSKNMIGRIATKYNLKTEAYGKMFYDKSPYSNKEVETFRYYERAIDEFRKHIAN